MPKKKQPDLSLWNNQLNATEHVVRGIVGGDAAQAGNQQISSAEPQQPHRGRPKADRETKKRVTFTLWPSAYEQLQKIAYMERRSASDIVSALIGEYISDNAALLKGYEKEREERHEA